MLPEKDVYIFSNSEFGELNVITIDGKKYFPATACAKMIGYKNPKKAISDNCRWVTRSSLPHPQNSDKTIEMNVIPEGDLYRLIIRSTLPTAERFESWVFDEVIPQINSTGGYIHVQPNDSEKDLLARALIIADKTITELKPKAEAYDTFLDSKGYVTLNEAAKSLSIGRNKMMSILRSNKILFKTGKNNVPYQKYMERGYFTVNHGVGRDGKIYPTTKVSAKGVCYIQQILNKNIGENHNEQSA
jgi:anti-repressor protein